MQAGTKTSERKAQNSSAKIDRPGNDNPYGIITVPMGYSNSYLIVSGGQGILVDAGYAGKIKNLQTALEKNNLTFSDIVLIVLTTLMLTMWAALLK